MMQITDKMKNQGWFKRGDLLILVNTDGTECRINKREDGRYRMNIHNTLGNITLYGDVMESLDNLCDDTWEWMQND